MRQADLAALGSLAVRLNVESYVLSCLGPHQRRLGREAVLWLSELRQRVAAAAVDNLRRDAELRQVLGRLAGEGVPFLYLKGSALRASRQGKAGRFQCDVDVLVRRRDLEKAEPLLLAEGFLLAESRLDRAGLLDRHFHLPYERQGAILELHWELDFSPPEGFTERVWEHSRPAEVDGLACRLLAPEHEALFGCLHLSRHSFRAGLRWLADLREQLPLASTVQDRFREDARAWPCRAIWCPLWLLAARGVPEAGELARGLGAGPGERFLLRSLLPALLLDEPWWGLPAWRAEKALHQWLFSDRPLLGCLGTVSRRGISRRLQAWASDHAAGGAP